ncbi:unnamed protein product, partial [Tetraodon nigroviridis]
MAVNETKILFESFLQKRKDTMLNLRGNYYIYTVQSVREVHGANSTRFLFELNMSNGKSKLLTTLTMRSGTFAAPPAGQRATFTETYSQPVVTTAVWSVKYGS